MAVPTELWKTTNKTFEKISKTKQNKTTLHTHLVSMHLLIKELPYASINDLEAHQYNQPATSSLPAI